MNDDLISMYIDDELSLDDKIVFVEAVHEDKPFKEDAISLLKQEKLIRSEVTRELPALDIRPHRSARIIKRIRSFTVAASAGLAAAAILFLIFYPRPDASMRPHRFVIYQPDAKKVELTGSFNRWERIPLRPSGPGGYWEITVDLPEGEHRFSYILEGDRRLTDPTIAVRETDDFGGENSILRVESKT